MLPPPLPPLSLHRPPAGHEGFRTPELVSWLDRLRQPSELQAWLPHLANHSHRHLFLCTTDSQYVYLGPHGASPGPEQHSIWVHLGDDHYTSFRGGVVRRPGPKHGRALTHGLTVPYRVSHWMPFGFPPPAVRKRHLLFSCVTRGKHRSRAHLHDALRNQTASLGLPDAALRLHDELIPVRTAAAEALRSTFCLAPTGDSKGFTARFYFSVLHGCIPVRHDGFHRRMTREQTAYPFPHLIEWERIVVAAPTDPLKLLERLRSMPAADVASRLAYMRQVAHWLSYDDRTRQSDRAHDRPPGDDQAARGGGGGNDGKAAGERQMESVTQRPSATADAWRRREEQRQSAREWLLSDDHEEDAADALIRELELRFGVGAPQPA